jgi:MoxR-like ATPase
MTLADAAALLERLQRELRKVIVGQDAVVSEILIAFLAGGHCLLRGVPGLAKTLIIKTLADAVHLKFSRIQFTPDLMPSDILGTEVIEEDRTSGARVIRFLPGPIFANIILADEINRTPPKTQAALLEAMQEYQVTIGGKRYVLDRPLFVLATQNPIEQEGTYPLPEAQLDRFMFYVNVHYPSAEEEVEIVRSTTASTRPVLEKVLSPLEIRELQDLVLRVPVADHVVRHAVELVRATRPREASAPQFVRDFVEWGAGPRASQFLVIGAKARAVLDGRLVASVEDVRALARPVLVHRVITNFRAESEGVKSEDLVARVLEHVKVA